jgi:tetratricopeptide (TPR) repeat protein
MRYTYRSTAMPISIRVTLAQQPTFELQCGNQSRRLDWKDVESLAATADREYYGDGQADNGDWAPALPQQAALGRRLFEWLDGPEGWLRTGLANGKTTVLLDLAAPLQARDLNPGTESLLRKLAHLPWELLHDGNAFLAERGIQPVRVMQSRSNVAQPAQPANRPLRLLFMATSPEDVLPELNYEQEETNILEATRQQPIELVVEESGSVSQLQNLVAAFDPHYFDVFHITGHVVTEDGTPQFLTEDERGGKRRTTAEQLAEAFGRCWPRLLFLSGCHTAQASDRGTIRSMAHALVNAGADAVLGWAQPVYDSTGIFAATQLYRALATGETTLDAVAAARREMLREFLKDTDQAHCSDWHLLRLYQGVRDTAALVTPLKTPKREQIKRKAPEADFLDADGNVKVAGASAFFGRRREMQRCLKALAYPGDHYGVFLHGLGGYGKSTIAARLCRRHEAQNPGFERVVLIGPVDEARLRQRLSNKFGGIPEVIEVLNQPKIEFKHQLAAFFNIIEGQGRRLLLVLDELEQNIPPAHVEAGSLRLAPDAWRALEALCFALEESSAASRLIVTCRYYSAKELPANRLFVEGLSGMLAADIGKKTRALVAGVPAAQRNPKREEQVVQVADGNPRLLERLMALALRPDVIEDAFLDRLGAAVREFRENLLAEKLIGALSEPERKALARMTLFELPVPMAVVMELAEGAPVESAIALGLLEEQVAREEHLYRVTTVLEPLLRPALNEVEWSEARRRAARILHKVWWEDPDASSEARGLEVVRVAVAAGEQELAVGPADAIATGWINGSRYREALALCRLVLAAFDDYRSLGTIARAEVVLGDTESAKIHYERALSACPTSDDRQRSATMHNLAGFEAQQGNFERALQLWQQSLDIRERTSDMRGKAATISEMAGVIAQQGHIEKALQLCEQSLEIQERIGDLKGRAATLQNMAVVIAQQGDTARALRVWQESLGIQERYGDLQGEAATLNQMAEVVAQQGDPERALQLCQRSLEVFERIGDVRGTAATLANLAAMVADQGDIERALQLWQRSLEIQERIGNVRGEAANLHAMAGVIAQQGDIERALQLWQRCLEIDERIGDPRGKAAAVNNIAGAIAQQGDVERALQLWQQSLEIKERIGDVKGKAATLHNMAGVIAQQGDIERALQLWQQSLEIEERIGDVQGKAATLHQMAGVIAQQGDIERALQLWQQSLEIKERIGDVQGKAATLHAMAGVIAQWGDVERALQLWQQSLEIKERIGDAKGRAATLHNMAGAIAQQGDVERALQLWQQSAEIEERIGNVQGKAATLANMAWAAGQSGDRTRGDELNRQAARALGSARAYVDLITVLSNLGASAQQEREIYAAQAVWLALTVHARVDDFLQALQLLFDDVPQGDPLEPLLGAAATILVATRGENHPQREKLFEQASKLLSIAAGNTGTQTQEAFQRWVAENRLNDSAYVFPRLLALTEKIVGDRWIFDRAPLLERAGASPGGHFQEVHEGAARALEPVDSISSASEPGDGALPQ